MACKVPLREVRKQFNFENDLTVACNGCITMLIAIALFSDDIAL